MSATVLAGILSRLASLEARQSPRPRSRIPKSGVARRYNKTPRTVDRWRKDPKLNFPSGICINGRWYWDEDVLDAWDLTQIDLASQDAGQAT
jgi:hypothetical protein